MIALLKPAPAVDSRLDPMKDAQGLYVRSFLFMRVIIGALGVALPVLVVLADGLGFDEKPFPRGAVSAYYYSGMREEFVVIMGATGIFLVAYKIAERNLDNTASIVAGLAAVIVAVFPTGPPKGFTGPLTKLQDGIGQSTTQWIHYTAAAIFLVSMAVITYCFGRREDRRLQRPGTRAPGFWKWFHWSCTGAIVLALAWLVATKLAGSPSNSVLIGEWAAAWAFGVSWFFKGFELDMLRGNPTPPTGKPPSTLPGDLDRPV